MRVYDGVTSETRPFVHLELSPQRNFRFELRNYILSKVRKMIPHLEDMN